MAPRYLLRDHCSVRATLVARAGEALTAAELGDRLAAALLSSSGAVLQAAPDLPAAPAVEAQAASGPPETTAPAGPTRRGARGPRTGA